MHECAAVTVVCTDFPVTPLDNKVLQGDFANLLDMFTITNAYLGICFDLILKNQMAATDVSLMIIKVPTDI